MKFPERLLALDIETSEQAQDGKIVPITVASTVTSDGEERAWFSDPADPEVVGMTSPDKTWAEYSPGRRPLAPVMSKKTAQAMLDYMAAKVKQGYVLCAWNGASFDLQMIGALAGNLELAGRLALELLDPMYQVLSQKGFPIGLKAAAAGLKIDQAKSMDGKDAPEAWANGEYQKVISYVIGDSQMTLKMMKAIAEHDGIAWITKTGKQNSVNFTKFKTVIECFNEPQVDQSWMLKKADGNKPIDKKQILAWIPATSRQKATVEVKKAIAKEKGEACQGFLPVLFVVSGPSGAGKTVLRDELMRTTPSVMKSTTVTTRPIRTGETDGVDYNFVTEEKFDQMIKAGAFFEWAKVHDFRYGSSKADISHRLAMGEDVILILDVQGAATIRKFYEGLPPATKSKFRLTDIFVTVPSMEVLRNRLAKRGQDDKETIETRMTNAKAEMARMGEYKYVVMNDDMHTAWTYLYCIVMAERCLYAPAAK